MGIVRLKTPAKINLYLKVISKRSDGYHNINTLLQMISLYDSLTFKEIDKGVELIIKKPSIPKEKDNLVYQAALKFIKEFNIKKGVRIHLKKDIPLAAGLGGGSSDTAATLIGLSRLWGIQKSRKRLIKIGATIGADVPFFFYGPLAFAFGRGDNVRPITPIRVTWLVLINPGFPILTGEVYNEIDKFILTKGTDNIKISTFRRINLGIESIKDFLYNDLEKVAIGMYPEIQAIKEELLECGAKGVLMSGSGPTVFGIFLDRYSAERAGELVKKRGRGVWVVRSLSKAPY